METKNPPQVSMAGFDIVTFRQERYRANNTHYNNSCKIIFTGHGVYSCHPHDSIKIKIKKIIVQVGSYAPDLAYWLLNVLGLRGA